MPFAPTDMKVTSTAFENLGVIPTKHTAEGEDVSPPLAWDKAPDGTKALAVICHDPDAPLVSPGGMYGFVHWTLYNIPAGTTSLAEGTTEFTRGKIDTGGEGFGGIFPPNGHGTHHYFFWVVALDKELDLEPGLTMWQFLDRAEPHILGMNRLVGTYRRA